MAKAKVLKEGSDKIYPITSTSLVIDPDGKNVETRFTEIALNIGEVSSLKTEAKTDTVSAINEVATEANNLVGVAATSLDGDDADTINGGKTYTIHLTADEPELTINTINASAYESIIYLTIDADAESAVSLPESYKSIGTPTFEDGKSYVVGILNGILISNEITEV